MPTYVWKWLLTVYPSTGSVFITVPPEFELPPKLPEKLQPRSSCALAGRTNPITRTMAQARRILLFSSVASFVSSGLPVVKMTNDKPPFIIGLGSLLPGLFQFLRIDSHTFRHDIQCR